MVDKEKIRHQLLTTTDNPTTSKALLALRVVFGVLMLVHGAGKLVNFSILAPMFPDPIGIGETLSLTLSMLAETIGSIVLIAGFMTRPACAIMIINLFIAIIGVHKCDILGAGELAFLYLAVFGVILYLGAGAKSLDAKIIKRK